MENNTPVPQVPKGAIVSRTRGFRNTVTLRWRVYRTFEVMGRNYVIGRRLRRDGVEFGLETTIATDRELNQKYKHTIWNIEMPC